MSRKDWGHTPCILKVKKLNITNESNIPDVNIEWKFDKETGELFVRLIKNKDMTFGNSETKICEALRDYNKWY
jgi:hypothetical protein